MRSYWIALLLLAATPSTGFAAPLKPLALRAVLDPTGEALTLIWESAPMGDLAGYNVYRRSSPRGTATKINPYLSPIPVFAERRQEGPAYYSVRSVDVAGQESADSALVDAEKNVIFIAEDGRSSLTVPGHLADIFRPSRNKYDTALTIDIQNGDAAPQAVRVVDFRLVRGDTGEEVTDIAFPSPEMIINLDYNTVNGHVVTQAASASGTTPDQLSLFWFNGAAWIKLGGTHDQRTQSFNVNSARLGRYQLRAAPAANSLSLSKANVYPGLLTPNGDGFNDRVYMVLENPHNVPLTASIFDLSGRHVATLPPAIQTAGVGSTLSWPGQDSSGAAVPSGLYWYKIEGEGKAITGTVSVAR